MNQLNRPATFPRPVSGLIIVVCVRPPSTGVVGDFNGDGNLDLA